MTGESPRCFTSRCAELLAFLFCYWSMTWGRRALPCIHHKQHPFRPLDFTTCFYKTQCTVLVNVYLFTVASVQLNKLWYFFGFLLADQCLNHYCISRVSFLGNIYMYMVYSVSYWEYSVVHPLKLLVVWLSWLTHQQKKETANLIGKIERSKYTLSKIYIYILQL